MSGMKSSADIFEAMGYAWNHPNYLHDAAKRGFREKYHPDGTKEIVDVMDIKGSQQPVGLSPTRAKPKPAFHEPKPVVDPSARLNHNRRHRVAVMLKKGNIYK